MDTRTQISIESVGKKLAKLFDKCESILSIVFLLLVNKKKIHLKRNFPTIHLLSCISTLRMKKRMEEEKCYTFTSRTITTKSVSTVYQRCWSLCWCCSCCCSNINGFIIIGIFPLPLYFPFSSTHHLNVYHFFFVDYLLCNGMWMHRNESSLYSGRMRLNMYNIWAQFKIARIYMITDNRKDNAQGGTKRCYFYYDTLIFVISL